MRMLALKSMVVLCGLLLIPIFASAQTAAPAVEGFNADPRLKQNVAVHAEGIPVGDLLDLLSRKTGVSLKADPYVADDKVVVFSPSRPLRATLVDLAALFNDTWEEAPLTDGKMRYTLVRRFKAQRYEDDLEQQVITRMKALLDAQVKALDETEQEFAKRPATDRIRQNLEHPSTHGRQATRLYGQLSPEQKDTLFADGFLNISFASSSPAQQAMAREAFGEVITTLKAIDAAQRVNFPEVHIVIDPPEMLMRHGLRFRLTHTNNAGLSAEVLQVILGANTYMTMGSFESADKWLLPAHGNPYLPKEKLNTAELPEPKSVLEAAKNPNWIDRLRALAEAEHIPILSDYYRSPALLHDLSAAPAARPGEPALAPEVAALDTLCRPAGFLWWRRSSTLLMRKRDWYTQRRYEVADRWVRGLQQRLQKQKSLPTYSDLCQLLDLTRRQISGLNAALSNTEGEGALIDLDREEGLCEMLRLIQVACPAPSPLPMGTPTEILQSGAGIDGGLSPQTVSLLTTFLNTLRLAATPENLRDFSVHLSCNTPDMLKAARAAPPPNLSIAIEWKLGVDNGILNSSAHTWYLCLPLKVPYDRSDRTKIE
ncbi:MAG: hypothetical protein JWL77_5926 [Chthonomonadaceae bacterium]|nr:hypothetical protein [Chthonomonadaceae bacterium]